MNFFLLLAASICAGFLPMILWAGVIWWLDRYEKEPLVLLGVAFFWGIAPATVLALLSEFLFLIPLSLLLGIHTIGFNLLLTGLIAPILEETTKALGIIVLFLLARTEIDGPLDGIVYAALVGLGFTATENVLYFLSSSSTTEWVWLVFMRAFLFGLNHAVFAALVGFGLAMAFYASNRITSLVWGLGGWTAACLLHILFNTGLVLTNMAPVSFLASLLDALFGISLVLILFLLGLWQDRSAIIKFLPVYVKNGLITPEDFTLAQSVPKRLFAEWKSLLRGEFSTYQRTVRKLNLLAELALKEKQKLRYGNSPSLNQRIERIIGKLAEYRSGSELTIFHLV